MRDIFAYQFHQNVSPTTESSYETEAFSSLIWWFILGLKVFTCKLMALCHEDCLNVNKLHRAMTIVDCFKIEEVPQNDNRQ